MSYPSPLWSQPSPHGFTPSVPPSRHRMPAPARALHHRRDLNPLQWVAFAGAGTMVIGCLLPWVRIQVFFVSLHLTGTDTSDGKVVLALSAGAGLLALLGRFACGLATLAVAAAGVIAVTDIANLQGVVRDPTLEGSLLSVGSGLWLVAVGVVITFFATLLVACEKRVG